MPSIRIDDEVYGFLKQRAEPFVDSPNSVLRRLLGLDIDGEERNSASGMRRASVYGGVEKQGVTKQLAGRHKSKRIRARVGSLLPEEDYVIPILAILDDLGGAASARKVISMVGHRLNGSLTKLDKEVLSSGGVRWEKRCQFARLRMVERGLLAKDSSRGVWEISKLGLNHLRQSQ